jgi:competence protein ComFC
LRSRLFSAGWKVIDCVFPPSCAGCGKWGIHICQSCWDEIKPLQDPLCQLCGEPLKNVTAALCERCQNSEIYFTAVRSWAYFDGPLQLAIHRLKYKRDMGLGQVLAVPLADMLHGLTWKIDLVTMVPLDKSRKTERGYNQCYFIAQPLAWMEKLEFISGAIKKVRETRSQVGLSLTERRSNLEAAFEAAPGIVKGRSVLIVDDVITTGSTMNACAEALIQAQAQQVYGLSLARSSRL